MQFSSRLRLWWLEVAGTPKSLLDTHKLGPQESLTTVCAGEPKCLASGGIWGTHVWKLRLEISDLDKSDCLGCWVVFSHAQRKSCCLIHSCQWSLENVLLIVSITANGAGRFAWMSTVLLSQCWLWSLCLCSIICVQGIPGQGICKWRSTFIMWLK